MKRQTNSEPPDTNKIGVLKSWARRPLLVEPTSSALAGSSTFQADRARRAFTFARILSCLLFCLTSANVAFGQSYVSYVSSAGNDGNPCKLDAPCRTVNRALATAGVGGTVMLTDAGPYDAFVISRSASVIAAPKTAPQILAQNNDFPAIRVALPAGEAAYLEDLIVNTVKPGGFGILWASPSTGLPSRVFSMKNCVVSGFSTGLQAWRGGNLVVDTCTFSNCAEGITLAGNSEAEQLNATIQYTVVRSMRTVGINCGGFSDVGIHGCQVSMCDLGIVAAVLFFGYGPHPHAYVTVLTSSIYKNRRGITTLYEAPPYAEIIRLGNNMIFNNSYSGSAGGCDLGGNSVFGNGNFDGTPDYFFSTGRAPSCPF